ncbi:MAG: DMT family transporter [Anaerolineae bacterium]|nr:DMT family transporter [Anaerolineae bacterium]
MTSSAPPVPSSDRVPTQVYLVLLAGIIAVSFASIFIRYAQAEGVPSLVIAVGRLSVAALVVTPVVLSRHRAEIAGLGRREWLLIGISGLFLAIHFAAWVESLNLTQVLISVVIVSTGPIWVALLEATFLRARLSTGVIVGIIVAVVGGVIIGVPASGGMVDFSNSQTLNGAFLALIGAVAVSVYVVIGRTLRPRMSIMPYIWLVYSVAALILLAVILVTRTSITGYSTTGYLWIVIMGLVPQLIGHSSFNYALAFLPATLVSIAAQVEPIGSALAAYVLFDEVPTELQIVGSAVLVVGVTIAVLGRGKS